MNARQLGRAAELERVQGFLRGIGIPCAVDPRARGGFLDDVRIENGGLIVKPAALISNVLHEAGHLAVLPGRFRKLATDDVDVVTRHMLDVTVLEDPDSPLARAVMQCGDTESTAWAWAAGVHNGIAPRDIIRHEQYGRTGVHVRRSLAANAYVGINGLSHAGFCVVRPGVLEKYRGLPAYPKLAMWVQRDFEAPPVAKLTTSTPLEVARGNVRELAV